MRAVLLSFAVLFVALAAGVFGHHMLTTGHSTTAMAATACGAAAGLGLSRAVARVLKKETRLWPPILSALFHVIAAAGFLGALQSPDLSTAFKVVSVAAGASLALCGCIPLFTRENA